ncbi:MAG: hypothetical protein ACP5I6_05435 [Caldisphaera sp.]|jgi:ketopantoate hydroxymethyltransferase|nr:hypothetical protein [Caldisphaera sp.]PMP60282.1 MAG: hypothetical protein C0201_03225 [Caldisphaera sp.]PMP88687.1 MAG: hypothetical protein C0172_02140 [Caldisphaera sp.]
MDLDGIHKAKIDHSYVISSLTAYSVIKNDGKYDARIVGIYVYDSNGMKINENQTNLLIKPGQVSVTDLQVNGVVPYNVYSVIIFTDFRYERVLLLRLPPLISLLFNLLLILTKNICIHIITY